MPDDAGELVASSVPRTLLAALALAALICACSPVQRQASGLARGARYAEATQLYLEALRANPRHGWAASGSRRYGELAYLQLLDVAREREAEEDYVTSLAAYDDVIGLVAALKTYDTLTFTPDPHLREERAGVRRKLLETRYREGIANASMGRWDVALTRFQQAAEIEPGYLDIPEQIERSHRALADQAFEQRRYADAVAQYQAAHAVSGNTDHLAWASAILAAEGRYYLRQGACRQAVDAFETALPHVINDAQLGSALEAALDCARIELTVEPFEVAFGIKVPDNLDLGALVADKLTEKLNALGSRHIRLIDHRLARSRDTSATTPARYSIDGRLSRLEVQRLTREPTTVQTTGIVRDLCPGTSGYYTSRDAQCDESVQVAYRRDEDTVEMKLSASIRVLDPRTGEQKLTRTHDASAFQSAVHLSEFTRPFRGEWVPTAVAETPTADTVALTPELIALMERPAPLPTDADMVSAAAENLADEAAAEILSRVDHEKEAPPPKALANIRRPVTDAGQIELESGDVTKEDLPGQEPQPVLPEPETPDALLEDGLEVEGGGPSDREPPPQ